MKKSLLGLILFVFCAGLFAAEISYKVGSSVYVAVKTVKVGKTVVTYGEQLIVDGLAGKKIHVHLASDESVSGTISVGSVTKKKIVKTSGVNTRTSSDELSLAGKGFSETAENAFKAENSNLDFELVDEIEKITVSQTDLDAFVQEGDLCAE